MLFDSGYDDLKDHAQRHGIDSADQVPSDSFLDTWSTWDEFTVSESLSSSEIDHYSGPVSEALDSLYSVAGEPTPAERLMESIPMSGESGYRRNRRILEKRTDEIRKLQQQYPDAGLKTMEEIQAEIQEKTRGIREQAMKSAARARGVGKLGVLAGTMTAIMRDPVILATLPFGAAEIKGGSIIANAWRAFKTEAAIAGGVETLIQPQVYGWKQEIESPYSIKEAATNIMLASVGAGGLRATGSAVLDITQVRKVAKQKRAAAAEGDKSAAAEADVLDQYLHLNERAAGRTIAEERTHTQAVEQAMEDLQAGQPTQATGEVPGQTLYQMDPREIEVDAKTFQFKEGGDAEGVIDTLRGVDRWDPELANTVMIWERADGTRFIADGHQRLALAKRAIAGGQPVEEVRLHAILYRESDGYTPEFIRAKAAMRNIAMGVGTEIEAAKVLRELSEIDLLKMPKLPPKGRIVASAKGLANLEDEAFQMVVNGMVDARFAAIIGEMIPDGLDQRGVIAYLSRHKPDNLDQARLMVTDIRAAGFERRETMDLFGTTELSETLFKERAQVIDAAMKKLRTDKKIFKTLEEQAGTITEAGNVLDRATNLERMTADERALAILTSLANRKGPVSDAVNAAARRVRDGEKPAKAIREVLDEVTQEASGTPRPKPEPVTEAKIGQPVRLNELTDEAADEAEHLFRSKQKKRIASIDDLYGKNNRIAVAHQRHLNRIGAEISEATGATYAPPPKKAATQQIKGRARVEEKVHGKYEGDYWKITDIVRTTFILDTVRQGEEVLTRLADELEVLDEFWNRMPTGYFDRKVLVRFKDGRIGEIQLMSAEMHRAKFELGGHNLYKQWRELDEVKGAVERTRLNKEMVTLYDRAMKASSRDWNELLEVRLDSMDTSSALTSRQARSGAEIENARVRSPSRTSTAGIPSHQQNSLTSSQRNSVDTSSMSLTSTRSITKDTKNIYQDTPGMEKIIQDEMAQVQRIIDEGADLEIPAGVRVDENGEMVVDTQSMRAAFDDLAEEERLIDDMFACNEGAAHG